MDDNELAALFEWLTRPTAIAPADGLPVVVTAVRLEPDEFGDDQLAIEYQVPPLPRVSPGNHCPALGIGAA